MRALDEPCVIVRSIRDHRVRCGGRSSGVTINRPRRRGATEAAAAAPPPQPSFSDMQKLAVNSRGTVLQHISAWISDASKEVIEIKILAVFLISKGGIFEAGFGERVVFSWPSVDRFGEFFGGLMTLGQVKSVSNFC